MEAFRKLYKPHPARKYSAGEIILHQGETPDAAYIVGTGIVKSYNISSQGDEKPITFERKGDILSTAWVFGKVDHTLFFYEAYTDCTVYKVPREELTAGIHENKEIMAYLLDRFTSANAAKSLRLNALEHSKAADKVVHMLLYLSQAYGIAQPDGTHVIDLPLTQQSLANLLGLTRETTGMELLKLKKKGLISLSRRRYRVQREELANMSGDDEFEHLEL